MLFFDTLSAKTELSSEYTGATIAYKVDTFFTGKLKATFSGTIMQWDPQFGAMPHVIKDGKFSCQLGVGDDEPKKFSFNVGATRKSGYIASAKIISNSLIMEGRAYAYGGQEIFKLIVRTGGTIKAGTYNNNNGDVGLQYYIPSGYPYYVNDIGENFSVTINSVEGNVIQGYFSGSNEDGKAITDGAFKCRIPNYIPQADSVISGGSV